MNQFKKFNFKKNIYRWIKKFLTFLTILLLTLFAGAPGFCGWSIGQMPR